MRPGRRRGGSRKARRPALLNPSEPQQRYRNLPRRRPEQALRLRRLLANQKRPHGPLDRHYNRAGAVGNAEKHRVFQRCPVGRQKPRLSCRARTAAGPVFFALLKSNRIYRQRKQDAGQSRIPHYSGILNAIHTGISLLRTGLVTNAGRQGHLSSPTPCRIYGIAALRTCSRALSGGDNLRSKNVYGAPHTVNTRRAEKKHICR
jgi:hypothetical protein